MNDYSQKFNSIKNWKPPSGWQKMITIDAHTAGEPLRIILGGYPEILGNTMLEKRNYLKDNFDYLRKALMWEPRGHADMYGCIITPPVSRDADFGVLFMHNEGYSTMCGHAIIAFTTVAFDTGMISKENSQPVLKIDTPSGLVTSYAKIENGKVKSVYFRNVPSFVFVKDETINIPGLGKIKYDIAFGGAYYAFVNADSLNLKMVPGNISLLIEKGMKIKKAIMKARPIIHPFEKDLNFLYGTIFIGKPENKSSHSRNVCIFADGEVDRSPTGTGVSARMALHFEKGDVKLNESIIIESIIGSTFRGNVVEKTKFGQMEAVIPEVEGNAFITGRNEFFINPDDPFKHGFILR